MNIRIYTILFTLSSLMGNNLAIAQTAPPSDEGNPVLNCPSSPQDAPVDLQFGEFRSNIGTLASKWNNITIELPAGLGTLHYSSGHAAQLKNCEIGEREEDAKEDESQAEDEQRAWEAHCQFLAIDHGFGAAWRYGFNTQVQMSPDGKPILTSGDGTRIQHYGNSSAGYHSHASLDSHIVFDSSSSSGAGAPFRTVFPGGGYNKFHNAAGLMTHIAPRPEVPGERSVGVQQGHYETLIKRRSEEGGEGESDTEDPKHFLVRAIITPRGLVNRFSYRNDGQNADDTTPPPDRVIKICQSESLTDDSCADNETYVIFNFDEVRLSGSSCTEPRSRLRQVIFPTTGDIYEIQYYPNSYLVSSLIAPDRTRSEFCYSRSGLLLSEFENQRYTRIRYQYSPTEAEMIAEVFNQSTQKFHPITKVVEAYEDEVLQNITEHQATGIANSENEAEFQLVKTKIYQFDPLSTSTNTSLHLNNTSQERQIIEYSNPLKSHIRRMRTEEPSTGWAVTLENFTSFHEPQRAVTTTPTTTRTIERRFHSSLGLLELEHTVEEFSETLAGTLAGEPIGRIAQESYWEAEYDDFGNVLWEKIDENGPKVAQYIYEPNYGRKVKEWPWDKGNTRYLRYSYYPNGDLHMVFKKTGANPERLWETHSDYDPHGNARLIEYHDWDEQGGGSLRTEYNLIGEVIEKRFTGSMSQGDITTSQFSRNRSIDGSLTIRKFEQVLKGRQVDWYERSTISYGPKSTPLEHIFVNPLQVIREPLTRQSRLPQVSE